MISPGDYSDTFRALGRFLEGVTALGIKLVDTGLTLDASWTDRYGTRCQRRFSQADLWALRKSAALYRGLEGSVHRFGATELLRTVGRELDDLQLRAVTVRETSEGFSISGRLGAEQLERTLTYPDLIARGQAAHGQRFPGTDAPRLGTDQERPELPEPG